MRVTWRIHILFPMLLWLLAVAIVDSRDHSSSRVRGRLRGHRRRTQTIKGMGGSSSSGDKSTRGVYMGKLGTKKKKKRSVIKEAKTMAHKIRKSFKAYAKVPDSHKHTMRMGKGMSSTGMSMNKNSMMGSSSKSSTYQDSYSGSSPTFSPLGDSIDGGAVVPIDGQVNEDTVEGYGAPDEPPGETTNNQLPVPVEDDPFGVFDCSVAYELDLNEVVVVDPPEADISHVQDCAGGYTTEDLNTHARGTWYRIEGTGNLLKAHSCPGLLSVYQGECDELTCAESRINRLGCQVEWMSKPGEHYYLLVQSTVHLLGTEDEGFNIEIELVVEEREKSSSDGTDDIFLPGDESPSGDEDIFTDECKNNARPAPIDDSVIATFQFSIHDDYSPCGNAITSPFDTSIRGAWFTVQGEGQTLRASSCPFTLSVFEGACNDLACAEGQHSDALACDFEWKSSDNGLNYILVQNTVAGVVYDGPFDLSIHTVVELPPTEIPSFGPDTPNPTFQPDTPNPTFQPDTPSPTFQQDTPNPTFQQDTPSPSFTPGTTPNPTFLPTPDTDTPSMIMPDQPTVAPNALPETEFPTFAPMPVTDIPTFSPGTDSPSFGPAIQPVALSPEAAPATTAPSFDITMAPTDDDGDDVFVEECLTNSAFVEIGETITTDFRFPLSEDFVPCEIETSPTKRKVIRATWFTVIGDGNVLIADSCPYQLSVYTGGCDDLICSGGLYSDARSCSFQWRTPPDGSLSYILVQSTINGFPDSGDLSLTLTVTDAGTAAPALPGTVEPTFSPNTIAPTFEEEILPTLLPSTPGSTTTERPTFAPNTETPTFEPTTPPTDPIATDEPSFAPLIPTLPPNTVAPSFSQVTLAPTFLVTSGPTLSPTRDFPGNMTLQPTRDYLPIRTQQPSALMPTTDVATTVPTGGIPLSPTMPEVETSVPTTSVTTGMFTIMSVIGSAANFSTLNELIIAADLVTTLEGEGPFTVFAPNNAAFEKLPEGALDSLLANPDTLREVLLYHVVEMDLILTSELEEGAVYPTAQGGNLVISEEGSSFFVNDARVIFADLIVGNGVLHVIDTVLFPSTEAPSQPPGFTSFPTLPEELTGMPTTPSTGPSPTSIPLPQTDSPTISDAVTSVPTTSVTTGMFTIMSVIRSAANLTTLNELVIAADLVATLDGEGPLTLFAPNNAAFDKLPEGALDSWVANPEVLREVLLYHVVDMDLVLSAELEEGAVYPTAQGENITISEDGSKVFVNDAMVIFEDLIVGNGVLHIIDSVLIPSGLPGFTSSPTLPEAETGSPTSSATTSSPTTASLPVTSSPTGQDIETMAPTAAATSLGPLTSSPTMPVIETTSPTEAASPTTMPVSTLSPTAGLPPATMIPTPATVPPTPSASLVPLTPSPTVSDGDTTMPSAMTPNIPPASVAPSDPLPTISPSPTFSAPPNDDCSDSTDLKVGGTIVGTTLGAKAEPRNLDTCFRRDVEPSRLTTIRAGVWYSFNLETSPSSVERFRISACNGTSAEKAPVHLTLYESDNNGCDVLICAVTINHVGCALEFDVPLVKQIGLTYKLLVEQNIPLDDLDAGGIFWLSLLPTVIPSNDDCLSATAIDVGDVIAATALSATPESTATTSLCNRDNGDIIERLSDKDPVPGVWYRMFVGGRVTLLASACGSDRSDLVHVTVYTGQCNSLQCASDKLASPLSCESMWEATSSESVYLILVERVLESGTDDGSFQLSVEFS
eukprot:Sro247_g098060.1 beta-induced protein ig-h3 (1723) ;mRNA; f:27845-33359